MVQTFTFDTGMLIALERRKQSAWATFRRILSFGAVPFVPAVVVAEFWRGRTDVREELMAACRFEAMSEPLSRAAGEALAMVRGSTLADAIVMASASLRGGGVVYTSDPDDLAALNVISRASWCSPSDLS